MLFIKPITKYFCHIKINDCVSSSIRGIICYYYCKLFSSAVCGEHCVALISLEWAKTYFLLWVDRDKKNPKSLRAWSLVTWDEESNSLKTVLTPPCKQEEFKIKNKRKSLHLSIRREFKRWKVLKVWAQFNSFAELNTFFQISFSNSIFFSGNFWSIKTFLKIKA